MCTRLPTPITGFMATATKVRRSVRCSEVYVALPPLHVSGARCCGRCHPPTVTVGTVTASKPDQRQAYAGLFISRASVSYLPALIAK